MLIIALYILIFVHGSPIKYDTNIFTEWDNDAYPSFICQSSTHTKTVSFSGTFSYIPKVFITQGKLDVQRNGNFIFRITEVTLQDFSFELECPTSIAVLSYHVQWWAIESPFIDVINCFNIVNPIQQTPYTHSNPFAVNAFVSLTSFQATGDFNFLVKIQNFNADNLTVYMTSLANITRIGYQIVLGAEKSFNNLVTMTGPGGGYTNPIPFNENKFFILLFTGFLLDVNDNIRLQKYYTIDSTSVSYAIKKTSGSYIVNYQSYLQIPKQFTQVNEVYSVNHLNIRSLEVIYQNQINAFSANFKELNKQYSNIGTSTLTIDSTHSVINIEVNVHCLTNNKFIFKLNYCGVCSNHRPYEQTKTCAGPNNTIKLFSRIQMGVQEEQLLTIVITTTSISITQLVESNNQLIQLNILSAVKLND